MLNLAFAVLALAGTSSDKVAFEWKPVVGSVLEYKTLNSHKTEMGGGREKTLLIAWTSSISIDKVEKDRVVFKIDNGEPTATIDGEEAPGVQVQITDDVEEHGLDGRYFKKADDDGFGFGLYGGFVLPPRALETGESYEVESVKAKYVGVEKFEAWDCHRFSFECRPKSGPWSSGDIWLSTKDLSVARRKIVLHGVDFGHGPEDIENEMIRLK